MQHQDHVRLIREGIATPGGVWADLGSGSGAFTLALADLLGPTARIYSVDRDARSLQEQARVMHAHFPSVAVEYLTADFTRKLDLPSLDGLLLANSLHYVRDKPAFLQKMRACYRVPTSGALLLVEYDTDRPTPHWVPYPLSFAAAAQLLPAAGWSHIQKLGSRPSAFRRSELYAVLGR